jgi:hypothetical protein
MRTRGRDKVLFSSDHPLLDLEKCVADLPGLGLPDDVLDAYAYANARRVFFGQEVPVAALKGHERRPTGVSAASG